MAIGRAAATKSAKTARAARPSTRAPSGAPPARTIRRISPIYKQQARQIKFFRTVRELKRELEVIRWEQFRAAMDERTCPECSPAHNREWREDQRGRALRPPLHVNCRCQVVQHRVTYRIRFVPVYVRRSFTRTETRTVQTGWNIKDYQQGPRGLVLKSWRQTGWQ